MAEITASLPQVTPEGLRAYLQAQGFTFESRPRPTFELWEKGDSEVLIPLKSEAPDYQKRLQDLISDLSQYLHATTEKLIVDLAYAEDDVIQLRLHNYWDYIPLTEASRVIKSAQSLAVAGACSTLFRRSHHGKSRPKRAINFARSVGMGHTARGSFIIPIISPVSSLQPVLLPGTQDPYISVETEKSAFPRRVFGMLADSLETIHKLIVERSYMPSKKELNAAVLQGVSSDTCVALADLISNPASGELDISFRWAVTASPPRVGRDQLEFPAESATAITEMGHLLKENIHIEEQVIYGFVSSLERDLDDDEGTVKVKALIGGRMRPVKMVLRGSDYHNAVESHDLKQRVVVAGTLDKAGNGSLYMSRVDFFRTDDYLPLQANLEFEG
ncbi:hypothetical protein [Streptosporangium sp. NPDC020145]|uniref:hypothetical protein n=1 Tax=Streptosporangium sp. NPDC020145 TaxID=3154694 RepID=UPI003432A9FC